MFVTKKEVTTVLRSTFVEFGIFIVGREGLKAGIGCDEIVVIRGYDRRLHEQ
jgi:hypothetical protein